MSDLVFVVGLFVGPPLAVGTCVLLHQTRQPRWVFRTALALSGVMALAWIVYWYLWGQAFDYADTYRPVPTALDRAAELAIAVCFVSTVVLAAFASSRLIAAWIYSHRARSVPST